MTSPDPYADRTHDDEKPWSSANHDDFHSAESFDQAGEPLCTATPLTNPASCLAAAFIDITRTAAPMPQFMRLPDYELQKITD